MAFIHCALASFVITAAMIFADAKITCYPTEAACKVACRNESTFGVITGNCTNYDKNATICPDHSSPWACDADVLNEFGGVVLAVLGMAMGVLIAIIAGGVCGCFICCIVVGLCIKCLCCNNNRQGVIMQPAGQAQYYANSGHTSVQMK